MTITEERLDTSRLYCPKGCGKTAPKPPLPAEVTHHCLKAAGNAVVMVDASGVPARLIVQTSKNPTKESIEMATTTKTRTKSTRTAPPSAGNPPTDGTKPTIGDFLPDPAPVVAPEDLRPTVEEAKATAAAEKKAAAAAKKAEAEKVKAEKVAARAAKAAEPKPEKAPLATAAVFPLGTKVKVTKAGWSSRGWMVGETGVVVKPGRARVGVKFDKAENSEKVAKKLGTEGGYGLRPECLEAI